MGNNLSGSKSSLHYIDNKQEEKKSKRKTHRDRANTSPLINSLRNLKDRSSLSNLSFRKKSDAKSPASSNSRASSTLSINSGTGVIPKTTPVTTSLRPNNSADKLSSLPHYLLPTNNQRDAKSLSPIKVRKPLNNAANLPPLSPLKAQPLNNKTELNQKQDNNETPLVVSLSKQIAQTKIVDKLIFDNNKAMALRPKTNPIYEDYLISKDVLGVGISGKVLICTHKQTQVKYALKVIN